LKPEVAEARGEVMTATVPCITIITNNVPRDVLYSHELPAKELAEFDYLDNPEEASFFRYKGEVYDLGEFMRGGGELSAWDGYQSDSYFSGILVKYAQDNERVIVGRYYS
jgi:hypothetical protein